jgi:hypothetical protein
MTVFFVGAHFLFSALLGGASWYMLAFSYALLWPTIFAFSVLPGVLVGLHMRTWQSSVVLTEIVTFVGATMIDRPTLAQLLQTPFALRLAMAQLTVFPPLLLSVLIGHHIRSWRSQKPT